MIISTKVICKQTGRYIGWPTIARIKTGDLLVVFSGDRDAHVCPWGKTQLVRSADQGKTWTDPVTVNNTPLDDRDAGIIETKDGTLLVSWFTSIAFREPGYISDYPPELTDGWARHSEKVTPDIVSKWLGNWVRRSEDGGKTWQEPVRTAASTPHGPIQLSDGRLLYIGRTEFNLAGKVLDRKITLVEISEDDGRTWKTIAGINTPQTNQPRYLCEPHVVEVSPGKLVAMFRLEYDNYQDCAINKATMWQAESQDNGHTWNTPYPTEIWGKPPHLIKLKDGRLLVTYGHRRPPFGERACLSYDEGKTWDYRNEIILTGAPDGDLGYPASVELEDGSIFSVYYQVDKPGEKACLMATHWKPPASK